MKAEKLEEDLKLLQLEMYHITWQLYVLWLIIMKHGNEQPEMIIVQLIFCNFLNSKKKAIKEDDKQPLY